MMRFRKLAILFLLLAFTSLAVLPRAASAHPMGNPGIAPANNSSGAMP